MECANRMWMQHLTVLSLLSRYLLLGFVLITGFVTMTILLHPMNGFGQGNAIILIAALNCVWYIPPKQSELQCSGKVLLRGILHLCRYGVCDQGASCLSNPMDYVHLVLSPPLDLGRQLRCLACSQQSHPQDISRACFCIHPSGAGQGALQVLPILILGTSRPSLLDRVGSNCQTDHEFWRIALVQVQ
jgi:hypothetical protein